MRAFSLIPLLLLSLGLFCATGCLPRAGGGGYGDDDNGDDDNGDDDDSLADDDDATADDDDDATADDDDDATADDDDATADDDDATADDDDATPPDDDDATPPDDDDATSSDDDTTPPPTDLMEGPWGLYVIWAYGDDPLILLTYLYEFDTPVAPFYLQLSYFDPATYELDCGDIFLGDARQQANTSGCPDCNGRIYNHQILDLVSSDCDGGLGYVDVETAQSLTLDFYYSSVIDEDMEVAEGFTVGKSMAFLEENGLTGEYIAYADIFEDGSDTPYGLFFVSE